MKRNADNESTAINEGLLSYLDENTRRFLTNAAEVYRFTYQEMRQLSEIARDLQMWQTGNIESLFPDANRPVAGGKQAKKAIFNQIRHHWQQQRAEANRYTAQPPRSSTVTKAVTRKKERLGLGYCPVASPKTRCCNLLTLDAVDNCGYGCSYCSIQSFYDSTNVFFDADFTEKLRALEIDPEKTYHIGTGQSSDSLMWGNSHGVLDALIEFAEMHPNVILELKTKSANVKHLLQTEYPKNIVCTWSLNTPVIIEHEELGSASLDARLHAARQIADKGRLVGFHFHPMVHYDNWLADYTGVIQALQKRFTPDEVVMVSLGTLTYIKPVIKQIRERGGQSQILKMPLEASEGKLSYPEEIKRTLFSEAYNGFSQAWREQVFFYLCMEHQRLWKPVFGFDYPDNDAFEKAMKQSYLKKILGTYNTGI